MTGSPLLVRDVMRIGVPTCKLLDSIRQVSVQMIEGGFTGVIVLDDDGEARGWLSERLLAHAYAQDPENAGELTALDAMDEDIPEAPPDLPLAGVVQLMADRGVDHVFFLHNAGGRTWPASILSLRDVVRALAGPEYLNGQGVTAARPSPIDLFRQRYGLPPKQ